MIKKFDEFINEGLWKDGIERAKNNIEREEDKLRPVDRQELKQIIKERLKGRLSDIDLNDLDVSGIYDMTGVFDDVAIHKRLGYVKMDKWDVSNVKDMYGMFNGCENFNADLSKWDVSNCVMMAHMFDGCKNFDSDLSKWNVSKCESMTYMFADCEKFNSDISNWDISNVSRAVGVFQDCKSFNQNLDRWKPLKLSSGGMTGIFGGCKSLERLPRWVI